MMYTNGIIERITRNALSALFSVVAVISVFSMLSASQNAFAATGLNQANSVASFLDGAFPSASPGSGEGDWVQTDYYPGVTFVEPIRIVEHPTENKLIVLSKDGTAHSISHSRGASDKLLFADLGPIIHRHAGNGEGGISDLVFHPDFANNGYVYVWYRWHPTLSGTISASQNTPGYNRLSRFTVVGNVLDLSTEMEMIAQYDLRQFHIAGDMFFGNEGFLYISLGDGIGNGNQTQTINGGFWSGMLRIDVDMDPARSHPIRRQPTHPGQNPFDNSGNGWIQSFSQNYYIPNDNPFVNTNGANLEEFFSIGLRHPWTVNYDEATGRIFAADVGSDAYEEVNLIQAGDNHQWGYGEGPGAGHTNRPGTIIGNEEPPILFYPRATGRAIIGAGVYRGEKFPELVGRYLYSDFVNGQLWAASQSGSTWQTQQIATISNGFPNGINSYLLDSKGDILMARTTGTNQPGGKIEMLTRSAGSVVLPEPPLLLSNTGAFQNLSTLEPHPGCIPYDLNVPFWSDDALKARWMCIPNDGVPNTVNEQIGFSEEGDWIFPVGSVLIKHFELIQNHNNPNSDIRLETRFIVHGTDGYYGVTYRWNNAGTEAQLLTGSETRSINVTTATGSFNQTWLYPGRGDCLECHTNVAGGVLGPNTRQLNGEFLYPATGLIGNQLESLNAINLLRPSLNVAEISSYLTSSPTSDEKLSLSARARSYLDSNCSYCHMPGGVRANFDARLTTPLADQGLIHGELFETLGIGGAEVIVPGNLFSSVLLHRVDSLGDVAMPPLAKDVVDEEAVDLLIEWILAMDSFDVGNDTTSEGSFIDGHHPSLYINEQDIFVQDNEPGSLYVKEFKFYARRLGNPLTPVVVRVNGDNNFTVLAIGTTRTQSDYSVGQNTFAFSDDGAIALNLSAGDTVATGFMDSFPDGSGWGAGTVIPAEAGKGADQDEIWALLPDPVVAQAGGFNTSSDTASVVVNQNIQSTNAGKDVRARADLRRSYKFAISFGLTNESTGSDQGTSGPVFVNGSFELPVVGNFKVYNQPNAIPGWTITDGTVEIDRAPWPASDGAQSLDLSGTASGSLEQTLSGFTTGANYELRFEYGSHNRATSPRNADVLIGGNVVDTLSATTAMVVPNYQTASIPFVADSEQQTFGFNSLSSGSLGVVIDNVRVVQTRVEPEPEPEPEPDPEPINNLALNQPTTQSTTFFDGVASRAVDGNTNGVWGVGSVTHTVTNSNNPWWRVDLGAVYDINQINIHNRVNGCCNARLDGAVLYVGNVNSTNPDDYTVVGSLSGSTAVQTYSTVSTTGRYVMVGINGTGTLSLAEVEVFGEVVVQADPINVALNKSTSQKNTSFNGASSRAVDGDSNGDYIAGSVTHTNVATNDAWWRVDLGQIFNIDTINVFNRTNDCCGSRLNDAKVYIGSIDSVNLSDYSELGTLTGSNSVQTIGGGDSTGRYVMIRIDGVGTLSLAEVQVLAVP